LGGQEGIALNNVAVANFTDSSPQPVGNYSATIDWGDGSPVTTGTVATSGGGFVVNGSHTYADEGSYNVKVTVSAPSAASSTILGSAQIAEHEMMSPGSNNTADARYVSELYHDLLHRTVDASGLVKWTGFLASGHTRSEVVLAIETSPTEEYQRDQVDGMYEQYLHRAADPLGESSFVELIDAGGTIEQCIAVLAGSPEYFNQRGGGTNAGFLAAFYDDALGRSIDPGAQTFWLSELQSNAVTRSQVAATVLSGDEYHQDVLQQDYALLLDRSVESAGMLFWTDALQSQVNDTQLIADIAGTSEYYAKTTGAT
jgi:hypothetical protein